MIEQLEFFSGKKFTGKIFRIYRDVRFSKDKTPYNPYLRIGFYLDSRSSGPALMLSIENNNKLILGCGIFDLPKEAINIYRKKIDNEISGKQLTDILEDIKNQDYRIDITGYKKIPAGYNDTHPRAELLKAKGITVWQEINLPDELYSEKATDFCLDSYKRIYKLFEWLDF